MKTLIPLNFHGLYNINEYCHKSYNLDAVEWHINTSIINLFIESYVSNSLFVIGSLSHTAVRVLSLHFHFIFDSFICDTVLLYIFLWSLLFYN